MAQPDQHFPRNKQITETKNEFNEDQTGYLSWVYSVE